MGVIQLIGGRGLVRAAKERELAAWKKFKVLKPGTGGAPREAIAATLWALTWEMVEGKKDVKSLFATAGH